MEKGLVTVVLPIYNVEKYLDKSVQSVVDQTYTNLEILLIDDGSTDSCSSICDKWAYKDSRIRVIHKENGGLGFARNTGIENATGEYICFFDSDDYIDATTIEKLYKTIEKHSADLVIFGFHRVDNDGNILKTVLPPISDEGVFIDDEVEENFLPDLIVPDTPNSDCTRYYMSACLFMYSAQTIKEASWRFVSEREIISEDVYSLLKLFTHIRKVAVLADTLYFYRDNFSSLSKSYMPGRYEKIKHFFIEAQKLCKQLNYNDEVCHRLTKVYLGFVLSALKQEVLSNRKYTEKYKSIKSIVSDDTLQDVLKQNKKDKVGKSKRIIYWAMRNKLYGFCFLLSKLKTMSIKSL